MRQRTSIDPLRRPLNCLVSAAVMAIAAAFAPAAASANATANDEPTETAGVVAADPPPSAPSELSVAPLDHVEYPSDRPSWVDAAPQLDPAADSWTVVSGPSETPAESAERLRIMTRAAIASYAKQLTGAPDADFLSINDTWIDCDLVEGRYAGTLTRGDTTLHESAVRLHFSPDAQEQIRAAWQETKLRDRLAVVAAAVGVAIGLLAVASALLSLLGTRGQRGRAAELAA